MNIKQKIAAAAVGVALLGGGAGLAVAMGGISSATTTDAAATAQAQGQAPGKAGGRRQGAQFLRRVVHGDLTVKAKDGFQKVTYDRGNVTSKTGNSFTLQRPDNVTVTIKVDDNTKYRGIQSLDELQVGKPAIVVSKDGTALMVGQRTGAGRQPAPASSGA